jgi:hypothetical protein
MKRMFLVTSFDQRKDAFENKFAHDEELRFKATARRNKLLGLWAAEKLGKTGADGDDDVLRKVKGDFESAGHADMEGTIRLEMSRLMERAIAEIQAGT